jgi:paraquat-inducible protein B
MSEKNQQHNIADNIPKAVVKEKRTLSLIWLIPLVALAIGIWLTVKAINEKGPTVTITFKSAEGLKAGKTKIKYKNVDVGQVEEIHFGEDLSNVEVRASLSPDMRKYLTDEDTQFWVVRARLAGGKVSGLGTILSGAYISMQPGSPGKKMRHFTGLDSPPPLKMDIPGTRYVLTSPTLSSLDIGTSIFYRKLKVGEVIDYQLDDKDDNIRIEVFIRSPYDSHVYKNTRFWNASGISAEFGADGVEIKTESIGAILTGGIAFGKPDKVAKAAVALQGHEFYLFKNEKKAFEKQYIKKEQYLVYFDGSVRGLTIGSPVTVLGMHAGQVIDMRLEYDLRDSSFKIPVLLEMESERLSIIGHESGMDLPTLEELVRRGLRAQLRSGSLLTGQLLIDLNIYENAAPAEVSYEQGVAVLPSIPTSLDAIKSSLQALMNKIEKMPLDEIGHNLNGALEGINKLANSSDVHDTLSNLNKASLQLNETLKKAEGVAAGFVEGSPAYQDIRRTMNELSTAARSLRLMMDYLERHPEALIKGK